MNTATAPVLTLVTDSSSDSEPSKTRKPGAKRNRTPGPKVYPRKGGGFLIRWKYRDAAGRPQEIKKVATGTTRTAAVAEARSIERAILDRMHADPSARAAAPTIRDFAPRFLDFCRSNERSPSTIKAYDNHLRNHVIPALGDTRLDRVTPADLESLKAACARLMASTRRQVIATVNRVLSVATILNVARDLPRAVQIKKTPTAPVAYSPDDIDRVLTACESTRDRALVYLAFHGGMRRGEVMAVRGEDFQGNPDSSLTITIRRSMWEKTIKAPKSGRERDITLTLAASSAIRAHMSTLADPLGWLFPSHTDRITDRGEPLPADETVFDRVMHRLCKDAAVKYRATHVLRKTGATALAKGGASIYEIQEFLGHAGVEMARHYVDREKARQSRSRAATMIESYTAGSDGTPQG